MSPVAYSGPTTTPGSSTMTSNARSQESEPSGKWAAGGVARGGRSGSGKAPFRHIDDIVSINVDLDPYATLRKTLEAGDRHMQQATTFKAFGRPDLALQEYIMAVTIAADKVPRHKDYPSLKSDRGDLNRLYHDLKLKINSNGAAYDRIKELIKEDNARTGVSPEGIGSKPPGKPPLQLPSVPSNPPLQPLVDIYGTPQINLTGVENKVRSANGHPMTPDSQSRNPCSPGRKIRPIVHPKPQALHGNSIQPVLNKASPDLVARFARLRDPQESQSQTPPPQKKPTGPRAMPSSHRLPLSIHSSLPAMPKVPDAIYSPARGTVTSEAANLPSSTPRGMFSRTNSIVSVHSTSARTSVESVLKHPTGEQFVTAHTYGDPQASPTQISPIPGGDLITVKELLRCMGEASVKLLLIDVRDRQLFDEGHIMSLNTICLDPTILSRQNISASEIADSMILAPTSEKLAFEQRDVVDLIVFYDQDSKSVPQRSAGNLQETIIFNLRQALIHYNFPKQLAHTPKLLAGGLDAWTDEVGQQSLQTSQTQSIIKHGTATSPSTRRRLRKRTLNPEEVGTFEAMIGRDETGDFDYAKTREDFMRRFPSVRMAESMVSAQQDRSSEQSAGSGGEEFLKDMTSVPPVRPKPSVARTRYSGLESADEHSPPSGVAMMAAASSRTSLPTGLVNPHNWCYANASIQALLASREFVEEFLDARWPIKYRPNVPKADPAYSQLMCRILGNLFQWLGQRSFVSMKASTLMHYLRTIHTGYQTSSGQTIRFGDGSQHDSDEFITFLFGQLEVETRTKLTRNPLPALDITQPVDFIADRWGNRPDHTVISRYWYLMELHTLTCQYCGVRNFIAEESERYEFAVMSDQNNGSLEHLVQDHFAEDRVESECDKCMKKGKVLRKQIARLPALLRVGIQRTDQTSSIKLLNHLRFPFDAFNLGAYALDRNERRQISKMLGSDAADGFDCGTEYTLFAVVAHAGTTLNSGHYICYTISDDGTWTELNDTHITAGIKRADAEKMLHRCEKGFTPVQLYYRRRN
ncbi:hypothetical protein F4802DRAFT_549591 [Xylaria palmicola]|nr:hypothetical protein F4802DRAFT_549591 [Xylaria palmicola]